jgi:hypothetical protein
VIEWALKPKLIIYFIEQAAHYVAFIGVLKTPFIHYLMASNKHSFSLQYDYLELLRPVAKNLSLSMEAVGDLSLSVVGYNAYKSPLHLAHAV